MEIATSLTKLSFEINRQIGLLISRNGTIENVIVGDKHGIQIPLLDRSRTSRLRGIRLVHTHLKDEPLSKEDLYDLTLLRLDYITAITINKLGIPNLYYSAYILPASSTGVHLEPAYKPNSVPENFFETINYIEDIFNQDELKIQKVKGKTRTMVVGVYTPQKLKKKSIEYSIQELRELCDTANVEVVDVMIQKRKELDPLSVIGSGKVKDLAISAIQMQAEMILFDLELSPAQAKRLSELCELKIIDRTQLILDIFARNAKSRDGKLQVELAQLRYLKGRLSERDDNMSRLTGGIGGRGPGETKLEIGRRRVNDRIIRLEKELKEISKRRLLTRSNRKNIIPIISIVGYTNAGKSTLLNILTNSEVLVENKLFATLEPTTRRLRFPKEREVVLSDTVGFIHDLPPELKRAFTATLEELEDANLLLHCIDASDVNMTQKINAVETILEELKLEHIPIIKVFNKCDQINEETSKVLEIQKNSVCISALKKINITGLLEVIEYSLFIKS